jgi:hypothetical protein
MKHQPPHAVDTPRQVSLPTEPLSGKLSTRFIPYQSPSNYMEPSLSAGDLAQIDTVDVRVNEGIYLLAFPDGEPALRRLQRLPSGMVRVSCDNTPDHADECELAELRVMGRATKVWNGRRV